MMKIRSVCKFWEQFFTDESATKSTDIISNDSIVENTFSAVEPQHPLQQQSPYAYDVKENEQFSLDAVNSVVLFPNFDNPADNSIDYITYDDEDYDDDDDEPIISDKTNFSVVMDNNRSDNSLDDVEPHPLSHKENSIDEVCNNVTNPNVNQDKGN